MFSNVNSISQLSHCVLSKLDTRTPETLANTHTRMNATSPCCFVYILLLYSPPTVHSRTPSPPPPPPNPFHLESAPAVPVTADRQFYRHGHGLGHTRPGRPSRQRYKSPNGLTGHVEPVGDIDNVPPSAARVPTDDAPAAAAAAPPVSARSPSAAAT